MLIEIPDSTPVVPLVRALAGLGLTIQFPAGTNGAIACTVADNKNHRPEGVTLPGHNEVDHHDQ